MAAVTPRTQMCTYNCSIGSKFVRSQEDATKDATIGEVPFQPSGSSVKRTDEWLPEPIKATRPNAIWTVEKILWIRIPLISQCNAGVATVSAVVLSALKGSLGMVKMIRTRGGDNIPL